MRGICIAALLCLAPSLHAGTWTVDDDGPADFPGIQEAITALPAGETILVQPGSYGHFVLDRRMQIFGVLGAEQPHVHGRSVVAGASTLTIAGLSMDALAIHGAAGRGRIEDCVLFGLDATDGEPGCALNVSDCGQLVVARTTLNGLDTGFGGTPAMIVDGSTVVLVGCTLRGGDALPPPAGRCGFDGSDGLIASSSHITAAGTVITGGNGGPPSTLSNCFGNGGIGLVSYGSFIDLRACEVGAGDPDIDFSGTPAPPLYASGGTVVSYGVGGVFTFGAVHVTPPDELPTLWFDWSVAPGGSNTLWLLGPIFEHGLLLVTLDSQVASLAHYEGLVWVVPQPLLMLPFLRPQAILVDVPAVPALSGTTLTLQAVYPGIPGVLDPAKMMTSNPDQLVIRY